MDIWKWDNLLVDMWFDNHYRVMYWETEFSKWLWIERNWIKKNWSYAKKD